MFELNTQQKQAYDKIMEFINSNMPLFLLEGNPGTGKTSIISHLFKSHEFDNKKIAFSATTNKAVSILEQYSTLKKKNIVYTTIQKLLNLKRTINIHGNEQYIYSSKLNYNISGFDIIIIDECSMICTKMIEHIINISNTSNKKFIFIGDRNQLPPVNESCSSIFNIKFGKNYIKLDKVERFKNDILIYTNCIKNNIKPKKSQFTFGNIQFIKDYNKWIHLYINTIDQSILLSYTNKKKRSINNNIRTLLFPTTMDQYNINEKIIFNNYYCTIDNKFYSSQHAKILKIKKYTKFIPSITYSSLLKLKISTDITICMMCSKNSISKSLCGHNYCYDCHNFITKYILKSCPMCLIEKGSYDNNSTIIFKILDLLSNISLTIWEMNISSYKYIDQLYTDFNDTILVLSDESKSRIDDIYDNIKSLIRLIDKDSEYYQNIIQRIWELFYNKYIDEFADIDYGYCITVHKSQGSTYKTVYVDIMDIIKNNKNDKKNCIFTAVTRASDKLLILL